MVLIKFTPGRDPKFYELGQQLPDPVSAKILPGRMLELTFQLPDGDGTVTITRRYTVSM